MGRKTCELVGLLVCVFAAYIKPKSRFPDDFPRLLWKKAEIDLLTMRP
jgi:hypothetical protein